MASLHQYAVILALAHSLYEKGSWCGETHLQKAMYFLHEFSKSNINVEFTLYKHGPYSFDFHDQLGELRNLGLITHEYIPPYGPRHKVTARGEWLIDNQKETIKEYFCSLNLVAECLGGKNVKELEKLSTALFVWRENPKASIEDRAKRLSEIKPHIAVDEAETTTQLFETSILPCFTGKECAA